MNRIFWILTTFIISCSSSVPTIESINLTGLEIPEYVDQRVWEFMPSKEGVTSLSIVYKSKFRTPKGIEDVEVCYEVLAKGDRYYGLVARVEGQWFVMVPGNVRYKCHADDSVMRDSLMPALIRLTLYNA